MNYYYCCPLQLEPGSIVKPGNWGRMMKNYTPASSNSWIFVRELAYEEVRKESFSEKPSRLECIFLCPSEDELRKFILQNHRIFDIAYEVELVDQTQPSHIGCLQNPTINDNDNYLHLKKKAELYWRGSDIASPEFITLSPIRIVREL